MHDASREVFRWNEIRIPGGPFPVSLPTCSHAQHWEGGVCGCCWLLRHVLWIVDRWHMAVCGIGASLSRVPCPELACCPKGANGSSWQPHFEAEVVRSVMQVTELQHKLRLGGLCSEALVETSRTPPFLWNVLNPICSDQITWAGFGVVSDDEGPASQISSFVHGFPYFFMVFLFFFHGGPRVL